MLRVQTRVAVSSVHGMGLFADVDIPQGTITWQYDPKFDSGFTVDQLNTLPAVAKQFLLYYTYFDPSLDKFVLCCDNQRYINHSQKKANVISTPTQDVAARDIRAGEELLSNYNLFDANYFDRLGLKPEDLVE